MKELKEIQFSNDTIVLDTNLVRGAILPKSLSEMDRDIIFRKDTVVEGAVYAHKIEVRSGDVEVRGAAFAQLELHVDSDAEGNVIFRKSVGAVESVVSHARRCRLQLMADVNARAVRLCNAFVAGSIFADEIALENCVVIGGVFATKSLEVRNSIVGTFNSPTVSLGGTVSLLLPSAFSFEPINAAPGTELYNLSLADLGSLYRKMPQMANSGRIRMNLASDEVRSTLSAEDKQVSVRSYSVVGKVLAADMLNWDKLQNHFLISGASLGSQLLQTYDLGPDASGEKALLTPERIVGFFFDLLEGKIEVQELNGSFSIDTIKENFI